MLEENFEVNDLPLLPEIGKPYNPREGLKHKRRTGFLTNNWHTDYVSPYIKELHSQGIGIWIEKNGKFSFRYTIDSEHEENLLPKPLAALVNNATGSSATIVSRERDADIQHRMIKVITKTSYEPSQTEEFYTDENGNVVRNLYRPSSYLESDYTRGLEVPPIVDSYLHSSLDDKAEGEHFIDEVANHFQTFITGHNTIVLKDLQTNATDILYNSILEPIYGASNSVRISDEELDTKFLAKTKDKLLVFVDKIPVETDSRKAISKQLQKLLRERAEYTLLIIATNEVEGLGIEKNPGGFSVLSADGDLSKSDYVGTGSYQKLAKEIKGSLEDFTNHLFYRKFELKKLGNVLETSAKDLILAATVNRIDTFVTAIKTKNIDYFESFNNSVHTDLYLELRENFYKGVVSKIGLTNYFNALEGEEFSAKAFMVKLKAADKHFFNEKKNAKGVSTGDELYIIDCEYNEYYTCEASNNIDEYEQVV